MKFRHRADAMAQLKKIAAADHAMLRQCAKDGTISWSTKDPELSVLVAAFREEVKDYYYTAQRRRCCYCSFELQDHKLTYDAEHILDKSEYPEYMFELGNIAAVCKHCNISKSNQSISASKTRFAELSGDAVDYTIVHPHLDEWNRHLRFDEIGRILPFPDSAKGKETILVCKIDAINAARLSDEFSLSDKPMAEETLRAFHEVDDPVRKKELLDLIAELANRYDQGASQVIVAHLAREVGEPPAQLDFNVADLPKLSAPNLLLPPPSAVKATGFSD